MLRLFLSADQKESVSNNGVYDAGQRAVIQQQRQPAEFMCEIDWNQQEPEASRYAADQWNPGTGMHFAHE